jgi:hypothetical protein
VDVPLSADAVVIIEKKEYAPEVKTVDAKAGPRKPLVVSVKLVRSVGAIIVEGPKGSVKIDGDDVGSSPGRFDVDVGPHIVTITAGGKTIYNDSVELEAAGGEVTVTPPTTVASADPATSVDSSTTVDEHVDTPPKPSVREPRGRYFTLSAVADVGFRSFNYSQVTAGNLRNESEGGQLLLGPQLELWPTQLLGIKALRELSLLVRFQLGVNNQVVTGMGITDTTTTFWRSFEASVRNKWVISDAASLEVGTGFVRDQFEFDGDANLLPDADYQSLRIGGRFAILLGSVEPYIAGETRIVFKGGEFENRFRTATAEGYRGAIGLSWHGGPLNARIEGAVMRYSWTFKSDPMDPNQASGATDTISSAGIVLGYSY